MQTIPIQDDFLIPAASWHEVSSKLINRDIERLLIKNLKIVDYTTEVKQYYLMVIAVQVTNPNHDNWAKYFSQKRGILYHNLKLDFEQFQKADTTQAYQMQAELYLQSITEIPTLRGMKKVHFDTEKFYEDTRKLFLEKGWLKPENQLI